MSSTTSIKPTKLISPNTKIKSSSTSAYQKPTCRWKINVGVYWRHIRYAYTGGFIRDTNGDWVQGYAAGYIGSVSDLDAELKAIEYGLQFGWDLRKPHVVLETDSLLAVKAIDEGDENNITIQNIRYLIRKLPWTVEVKHVKQEDNQVARHLATIDHGKIIVLDKPPREIANILK